MASAVVAWLELCHSRTANPAGVVQPFEDVTVCDVFRQNGLSVVRTNPSRHGDIHLKNLSAFPRLRLVLLAALSWRASFCISLNRCHGNGKNKAGTGRWNVPGFPGHLVGHSNCNRLIDRNKILFWNVFRMQTNVAWGPYQLSGLYPADRWIGGNGKHSRGLYNRRVVDVRKRTQHSY